MKTIENALSENVVDFNEEEEEDVSVNIIILRKMYGSIAVERFTHCDTCTDITHHFEKSNIISTETVIRVINELFGHYQSSWEFVVCVFVLIDILVWREGIMAHDDDESENYRANVNSKIASPISEILDSAIGFWVFFNGGWGAFFNQYNFSFSAYDQSVKYGEIMQQMRDFVKLQLIFVSILYVICCVMVLIINWVGNGACETTKQII